MNSSAYQIRVAQPEEYALFADWAAQEGWNPGLQDMSCYPLCDPQGFLLGILDGEPIACISAIKYSPDVAFLGFYIVRKPWRGQGYGWKLWQAAMSYLDGCTVGLDGVVDQQENYRKSGFSLEYRNMRYEGRSQPQESDPDLLDPADIPFAELEAYDQQFFPTARSRFLQSWLKSDGHRGLVLKEAGRICGYGVIRPCRSGAKVGPLFAECPEQAQRLFLSLQGLLPAATPLFLDVSERNPAAMALAEGLGMTLSFECARMYRGRAPELPLDRLFGICSFEVG